MAGSVDRLEHSARLLAEKTDQWFDRGVLLLPNLIAAVAAIFGFWLLGRLAARILGGVLRRVAARRLVINVLMGVARIGVLGIGFVIALSVLQLETAVTSLLAGVGVAGIALGFAFQDILANFISGLILLASADYEVGDVVKTGDFQGTVCELSFRTTLLEIDGGRRVEVPNRAILQGPLIHYPQAQEIPIEIPLSVPLAKDLDDVERRAIEAVAAIGSERVAKRPELSWSDVDGDRVKALVRFSAPKGADSGAVRSAAVKAIAKALSAPR